MNKVNNKTRRATKTFGAVVLYMTPSYLRLQIILDFALSMKNKVALLQ